MAQPGHFDNVDVHQDPPALPALAPHVDAGGCLSCVGPVGPDGSLELVTAVIDFTRARASVMRCAVAPDGRRTIQEFRELRIDQAHLTYPGC